VPVDKLHRDVQSSWMPVMVQVTPSESTTGMTARLSVTYGDTTELHDIHTIANFEKKVPGEWITPDGVGVTQEFLAYMRPLIQAELTPIYVDGLPRHIYIK